MSRTGLALTCRLETRETPTSFAARLAVRNFAGGAREFCGDVGISWKGLIRGEESEIERLAQISGAEPSTLQRYAFRALGRPRLRIGREAANIGSVRRTTPTVCPRCLASSIAEFGFAGAFRRADWQFISVRTCEHHNVPLIQVPAEACDFRIYDFAALVQKHWDTVANAARTAPHRRPTELEHHIRKRLSGWKGKSWIDSWPLPVVSKASEMLGARMEFGPDLLQFGKLSDEQLHLAGGKGFEVLRAGHDHLRSVLVDFTAERTSYQVCHGRDLGLFFSWLTNSRNMPGIKPLQDHVRDHIVERYPIEPGTIILGRRIDRPRRFTLLNAKRTLGIRRERLAHFIAEMTDAANGQTEPSTSLRAQQLEVLRKKVGDVISISDATPILGCRYEQVTRFIKAGMLVRRGSGEVKPYLSRTEVEAFAAPVHALEPARPELPLMPLQSLCGVVKSPVHEIYRCFLNNRLASAHRDPAKTGLAALLLNPEEVKRHLVVPPVTDPTMPEVAERLKTDTKTVRYLAGRGELRIYRARHHVTRTLQNFVDSAALDRFQKEFVTIGELAELCGIPSGPLAIKLDAEELRPRDVPAGVSRIYRRSDIECLSFRTRSGRAGSSVSL